MGVHRIANGAEDGLAFCPRFGMKRNVEPVRNPTNFIELASGTDMIPVRAAIRQPERPTVSLLSLAQILDSIVDGAICLSRLYHA